MDDAPLAPVLPSVAQRARLALACTSNATRHSPLQMVPVCPLPDEALATAAAKVDACDTPVTSLSPG